MADVAYIVEQLNAPPFNMKLLTHKFSDLKGLDLLQKVYDVFIHIIPKPKPIDVHSETDPTGRLMEYLKAVKYRPGTDAVSFRLALANCSRDAIYSLLKWILSQVPVLQQRATIGFYLTIPDVPAEFRGIQDITNRIMEIQTAQEEFKAVHQAVEAAKSSMPSQEELRKAIQRKENERASLNTRIVKAKDKAQAHPAYEALAPACKKLSQALQVLDDMKKDVVEEKEKRTTAERTASRAASRVADLRAALASSGAGADAVQQLKVEAARLRELANTELPKEIEGKRKRLQELAAARDVDSEGALQRLRDAEMRLRADITAAQTSNTAARARLVDAHDPDFRKLQALQDAAAKRARKLEELDAKAVRLRGKVATMQKELDAAGVQSTAPAAAVSHAEWEAKYAAVKALVPAFKARQAEQAALQAEADTLAATLAAVEEQRATVEARLAAMERAQGRVGHAAASMRLAKASQEASRADVRTGRSREEVAEVVASINGRIKSRKDVLAPKIKELRTARGRIVELTAAHEEARAAYRKVEDTHDDRLAELETQVASLQAAVDESEARFHSQAPLERLYAALADATSDSAQSLAITTGMREAAAATQGTLRGLRERDAEATRRQQGRSHEGADMMASVHALLAAKLEFMQVHGAGSRMAMNTQYTTDTANVLAIG
eukprot:jgi/Ulvmu1/11041/UM007_0222.1